MEICEDCLLCESCVLIARILNKYLETWGSVCAPEMTSFLASWNIISIFFLRSLIWYSPLWLNVDVVLWVSSWCYLGPLLSTKSLIYLFLGFCLSFWGSLSIRVLSTSSYILGVLLSLFGASVVLMALSSARRNGIVRTSLSRKVSIISFLKLLVVSLNPFKYCL